MARSTGGAGGQQPADNSPVISPMARSASGAGGQQPTDNSPVVSPVARPAGGQQLTDNSPVILQWLGLLAVLVVSNLLICWLLSKREATREKTPLLSTDCSLDMDSSTGTSRKTLEIRL